MTIMRFPWGPVSVRTILFSLLLPVSALVGQEEAGEAPATPADPYAAILDEPVYTTPKSSFYDRFIRDHLEIGTRISWFSLLDTQQGDEALAADPATRPISGSFLGSLTGLEEEQNYAPYNFFINYAILPWMGIGLSYQQVEVRTIDFKGGDGNFNADGPSPYLFFRYLNESRFTPYGEIGLVLWSISFDPLPEWSEGGRRQFVVEDDVGFFLAGGVDYEVVEHVFLDFQIRYVTGDAQTEFYFENPERIGEPNATGDFPLEHVAVALGAKWRF